ncbi:MULTISPECIES: BAR domain-like protein A BdpA [Rheinheimera]|uniref:Uncharacterized protein n=1 Tax=Rheinheimera marina TaxID=1774958 RepID=A0ABV9JK37_9GAMM
MRVAFSSVALAVLSLTCQASELVFLADFDKDNQPLTILAGCQLDQSSPKAGSSALLCQNGSSALVTRQPVAEAGLLEFWVKPETAFTSYKINVLSSASVSVGAEWQQIGLIEVNPGQEGYTAHRLSIDDPGRKYIRLDMESQHGSVMLDQLSIQRILLDTALQKNEQRIITGILDKLQTNQNYELKKEALLGLGNNYAAQLETQRQYLEYANGIYSGITFVLAGSERNKMSNPMAYSSFRTILADAKRVSSPLQQARLNSMVKPFSDLGTATLTVVSGGLYAAFAEPFKSFLATAFDKSNYDNADLSRKDRKFAEENGLKVYEKAEQFLNELEKELVQVQQLENDLQNMQRLVDSFRKDLDKHLRDYVQHAGLARTQENYSRVMSKEEQVRARIAGEVSSSVGNRAVTLLNSNDSTELIQYMLKTSAQLEGMQEFKERFNQITSAAITFYDKFESSVASEKNPFTDAKDKAAWEAHAQKARTYIRQSKEAFSKAYM